jgi:PAS domain S-box-containing protein
MGMAVISRGKIFRRQLKRIALAPILLLIVTLAVLAWNISQLTSSFRWVDRADVAIAQTRLVLRSIIDQESGLRGYLLTHDPRFLQHYLLAENRLPRRFDRVRELLKDDDPEQLVRYDKLHNSYNECHAFAEQAMAAANRHDPMVASVEFNLRGKAMMDEIHAQQEEFIKVEDTQRATRVERSLLYTRRTNYSALALAVLFGLTLVFETGRNLKSVSAEYSNLVEGMQRRAAELNESRERLQVTLRSIGDGVIVTDPSGTVMFLNPVAESLTQWTNEAAVGRTLPELFHIVHEQTREPITTPVESIVCGETTLGRVSSGVLIRPDGSELLLEDNAAPIYENEDLLGVILVFRDVTERRQAMDALRSNEKLVVAGRLSAAIAHEIHNPLDNVANVLYLLQQSATPEQAHLLTLAENEVMRVSQISKSLLGLYRESRQPVRVNLREVCESVAVLLEPMIRSKQITYDIDLDRNLEIMGFPAEIRQVVSNLVGNAIDAVETGGNMAVEASQTLLRSGRPGVMLSVRDNGVGIEDKARFHLFRPFFTTKGEKGTGLGLWVTQGIVEKHGGYIEVESKTEGADRGTIFRVYLPAATPTLNSSSQASVVSCDVARS